MDRLHRINALQAFLERRRQPFTIKHIMELLECSESTARRMIHAYQDDHGAPLKYDKALQGWVMLKGEGEAKQVPGAWFSSTELHALITARELLRQLEPGLLCDEIAPITLRIEQLLANRQLDPEKIARHIRIQRVGMRDVPGAAFAKVIKGVVAGKRLRFQYLNRARVNQGEETPGPAREVSGQRITWYRGNWYLDGWCHQHEQFRRFALERIRSPRTLAEAAVKIKPSELERALGSGYGIFTGPADKTAILRFTPFRARWVAEEHWHPDQRGQWLSDGSYQLTLPYAHEPELLMEILKYGTDCEVIAPAALRAAVLEQVDKITKVYEADRGGASISAHIERSQPSLGLGLLSSSLSGPDLDLLGAAGNVVPRMRPPVSMMTGSVQAGTPTFAEDGQEAGLDLQDLLVERAVTSYLVRVKGDSMTDAGIDADDLLLVDRSLEPKHGQIVIADVDGEFTVKRLHRRPGAMRLGAANPNYPDIQLQEGQTLQVWGVVTRVIKSV